MPIFFKLLYFLSFFLMYELQWSVQVLLLKKRLLKKKHVYRNKKLSSLYYYSDVITETNKLFKLRDFTKCIKGPINDFSFLFCTITDAKSTKGGEHYYRVISSQQVKRGRLILCTYTQWKSIKRWTALIHRVIRKQKVKNKQIN